MLLWHFSGGCDFNRDEPGFSEAEWIVIELMYYCWKICEMYELGRACFCAVPVYSAEMGNESMIIGYHKYYLRSWGYTSIYQCVSKWKLQSMKLIIWCESLKPSLGRDDSLDPPGSYPAWCHGDEHCIGLPGSEFTGTTVGSLQSLNPTPMGLRTRTSTGTQFPPPRTYNLKSLLKMNPFLTSWEGLALSGVGGGCFF